MKKDNDKRKAAEARIKKLSIEGHINDDAWMVAENLRQPQVQPRDQSVWSKTPHEREILKEYKHQEYRLTRNSAAAKKTIPVFNKLIVYTRGLNKTTHSIRCWQSEISEVLERLVSKGAKLIKYQWNGKVYQPNEVPAW